ncbi:transglutaminase family protein [Emticicia sp. C21]|uniref:transglutaminase-like domain-containing protein n=1 Tax=Emticicia sp. C21 TaxID=2302915 RepID=UPI000E3457E2|nr:transglutaminase-like domain-containing protein [Emticicia sp. C21]RFS14664.1 DUF3857 domain-containing protein [Emticicia sp. C21]
MKKTALLLWLVCCANLLYAQKVDLPSIYFGEVNFSDVEMKYYDKDSTADAVVLYDYGNTSFELKSGMIYIHFVYYGRIKILKKSALSLGTISRVLVSGGYGREQIMSKIDGFTYNIENGEVKKEKLTKESIFIEKRVGDYQNVKITMPKVKEGSVIDYTYTIDTPFSISGNPATWTFQAERPVLWSIYEISIPSYFTYRILMSGYLDLIANESKDVSLSIGAFNTTGTYQKFVMKDAPAFRSEPFTANIGDYLSKIDFELTSVVWPTMFSRIYALDYSSLNRNMLDKEIFGGQIEKTGFLKSIAKEIKAKYTDSTDRLKAACEYIQKNVKWDENFSLYSNNLKKVLESHKGDAGDINLLLIALLREMGFDANPVILSTRGHGKIHEQYALMKKFNYVVAHIEKNGKDFLMDATDEYLKLGMLPINCLNGKGWLVHPTNARFVTITTPERDLRFVKANMVIDEDSELKGDFSKSYGGYGGWSAKKEFKNKGQEKYLEDVKKENATWVIEKADYINASDLEAPMEAQYQVVLNEYLTRAGNILYLKPMLSEAHKENLFKTKERLYPIDFAFVKDETFIANYELPKDYSIAEMPKNVSISLPENGGKFTYLIAVKGNILTVNSRIQLRKPLYYVEDYPSLREFFDKIVEKHNEQIVLKKN